MITLDDDRIVDLIIAKFSCCIFFFNSHYIYDIYHDYYIDTAATR